MRYALRRASHAVLVLVAVSAILFLFLDLAPGDFLSEMRLDPRISPAALSALRARYGLDRPLAVRYVRWVGAALHGDLGYSFAYGTPAGPLLLERARHTLLLTGTALFLTWLIAVPLGAACAARPRSALDRLSAAVTSALLAVPDVVLSLLALLVAVRTGWIPVGGMTSQHPAGAAWADVARHLVAPVAVLVLVSLPLVVRHVRASVTRALEAPFVTAALAHGLRRSDFWLRTVLPAAANPLVSLFGLSLSGLLGGSLLVEVVMGWPGLGPFLLEAILARDVHVVVGSILLSTCLLIAGNLLADLLLAFVDPRIRTRR